MNLGFLTKVLEIVQKVVSIGGVAVVVLETILNSDLNGDGKIGKGKTTSKTVGK